MKDVPDEIARQSRADNFVVPSSIRGYLVAGHTEFLNDSRLVGLGLGSLMIAEPLRSPASRVRGLSPADLYQSQSIHYLSFGARKLTGYSCMGRIQQMNNILLKAKHARGMSQSRLC